MVSVRAKAPRSALQPEHVRNPAPERAAVAGEQEHGGGQGGGAETTEGEQDPTPGIKDPAIIESVTLNATP